MRAIVLKKFGNANNLVIKEEEISDVGRRGAFTPTTPANAPKSANFLSDPPH